VKYLPAIRSEIKIDPAEVLFRAYPERRHHLLTYPNDPLPAENGFTNLAIYSIVQVSVPLGAIER